MRITLYSSQAASTDPNSEAPPRIVVSTASANDSVFPEDDSNLEEMNEVMRNVEGVDGLRNKLAAADPLVRNFVEDFEREAFALIEQYHEAALEALSKKERMSRLVEELTNQNDALKQEMGALREVVAFHADVEGQRSSSPRRFLFRRAVSSSPKDDRPPSPLAVPRKGHRRAQSHHELSKIVAEEEKLQASRGPLLEVDPEFCRLFSEWSTAGYTQDHPFMTRVIGEDVEPCLRFDNEPLAQRVMAEIRAGSLCLEPLPAREVEREATPCALVNGRLAGYRMRLLGADQEFRVCVFARHRLMTACDFFTFLKHLQMRLVNKEESKIMNEIQSLRKQMALARLGFPPEVK